MKHKKGDIVRIIFDGGDPLTAVYIEPSKGKTHSVLLLESGDSLQSYDRYTANSDQIERTTFNLDVLLHGWRVIG